MMENIVLAVDGAWKVLIIGLLIGAGLPVLFAVGVRTAAISAEAHDGEPVTPFGRRSSRALSVLCFAFVVLGVLGGIGAIVASGFDVELPLPFN
ncbi:hypothetical protein [Demetria terragena]|uniref:hypothetical protein n=1 Tax=Demetria terragena TaxID=63959 RepID=UPI0003A0724A|nr:hypothetical protein [Demetria terragena]